MDQGLIYFKSLTNWLDMASSLINMIILIGNMIFEYQPSETLVVIGVALMWFKAFYWMRLFKPTAFFMNLLASTFVDIAEFIVMMVILIFAAANLFYIFNSTRNAD